MLLVNWVKKEIWEIKYRSWDFGKTFQTWNVSRALCKRIHCRNGVFFKQKRFRFSSCNDIFCIPSAMMYCLGQYTGYRTLIYVFSFGWVLRENKGAVVQRRMATENMICLHGLANLAHFRKLSPPYWILSSFILLSNPVRVTHEAKHSIRLFLIT